MRHFILLHFFEGADRRRLCTKEESTLNNSILNIIQNISNSELYQASDMSSKKVSLYFIIFHLNIPENLSLLVASKLTLKSS